MEASEEDIIQFKLKKFVDFKENKLDKIRFEEPSDLVTTVIVAVAHVNIQFHLRNIANYLYSLVYRNIIEKEDLDFRILGVIYDDIYIKTCLNQKEKKKKKINESEFLKPKKEKKNFFNQATIYVQSDSGKVVNIKIFQNGKTQMTGLKSENDGREALDFLIYFLSKRDKMLVGDLSNLEYLKYKIVNINNSFNLYFKVDRKKLYEILIENTDLHISHDRQRCAGMLIYYNYNTNNTKKDGVCRCMKELNCQGKGDNGTCKLCTISIFESGKGLVTGVNQMAQAFEAYNFIKNIINKQNKEIIKICIEDMEVTKEEMKQIKLKPKKKKTKKLLQEEI